MKILLGLLTAFALSSARAGDLADLEFWGFSSDARFVAFEQHGSQDGSGFPFSRLTVVDVKRNAFAGYAEKIVKDGSAEDERASTAQTLALLLKRVGIKRGLTGTNVFQKGDIIATKANFTQPLTSADLPKVAKITLDGKAYTLELIERPAPPMTGDCRAYSPFPAALLELKLSQGATSRALQKDILLPNSRKCVYSYGIARVYRYRSSVAVFLRTLSPGFEGPNLGWMVVTAKL